MKFLPFDRIVFRTSIGEEALRRRLEELVEPARMFRITVLSRNANTKQYEGKIDEHSFRISRIINYQNSFLPKINGTIERGFDGITISTTFKLSLFVMIFTCVWLGIVGVVGIVGILMLFAAGSSDYQIFAIVPPLMFAFGYGLTMAAYKYEVRRSKKDLTQAFEAEVVSHT